MEGSSIGNSAKPLELAAFSKTAQRAQTKGVGEDSKLQLSKDGAKVYFSHHRSGLKLQLTKLACTLTNFFGYDLKARVGVQPNESRQQAAATEFAKTVKGLDDKLADTLGEVKKYDGTGENQGLKVSKFKEFDLENKEKVIAYNKIVAEQFVMPKETYTRRNDNLENILQKLNIDRDAFMSDDFARTSYPILLKAAAEEGNQLLTTKDLQTRLEHKLGTLIPIIEARTNDLEFRVGFIKADLAIRQGLKKLDTALKENNVEGIIGALVNLKSGTQRINGTCDQLYPSVLGSVVNAGKYEEAMLDYLIAKNKPSGILEKPTIDKSLGMAGGDDQDPNHTLVVVLSSLAAIEDGKLGNFEKETFAFDAAKGSTVNSRFFPDLLKSLAKSVAGQDVKPNQQYQKACFGKLKLSEEGDDRTIQKKVVEVITKSLNKIDTNRGQKPSHEVNEPGIGALPDSNL